MRKIIKSLRENKGLIFIILAGFVPLLWFRGDLLIAGGDAFSLLNPGAFTEAFKYVWNEKLPNAGGMLFSFPRLIPMLFYWSILEHLGFSLVIIERIWIIALFLLPGITMYYFLSQVQNGEWAKIVASIFYMFNLFVMVSGPFQDNTKPVFIALPLMMALWMKGLSGQKKDLNKYAILISFSSLIYSGSNTNPPSVAVIPITFFLYFLFQILVERQFLFRNIRFALVTAAFYILVNAWWMLNFTASVLEESEIIRKVATFSALGTGAITDFFRLLGSWGWRSYHYKMFYYPYARFYDEPLLLFLSFLLPVMVFSAVLFRSKNRNVVFFSLLAVVGLFLSKGTAEPLGFLYKWIWSNVPGFWVFREPFAKFTPITVFAYSVLLGLGADFIYSGVQRLLKKSKYFIRFLFPAMVPIMTIIVVMAVSYPLFTGEVIWDYWNGSMRSYYVKVPQYWHSAAAWFKKNDGDGRVFVTPKGGYGAAYNWVNGFSTADDPATILIPNQVLRRSSPMSSADEIIGLAYETGSFGRGDEFSRLMSLLNARFVLQENDLDWRYTPGSLSPTPSNEFLAGNFNKVRDFGLFNEEYLAKIPNGEQKRVLHDSLVEELLGKPALTIYKMRDPTYLPRFYVPEKIIYSSGGLETLPGVISFKDYSIRSGVYLADVTANPRAVVQKTIEGPDAVFFKPEKVDLVENKSLTAGEQDRFVMPNASLLPDSPLYFLVTWKENRLLNNESDPLGKTDLELWLSSKRLVEIEKLVDLGKPTNALRVFERYLEQLKTVVLNLETFSRERSEAYPLINKANLFFIKHKSLLESIRNKLPLADTETRLSEIYSLFRAASALISKGNFQYYLINKPKEGVYNFLIRERQDTIDQGSANPLDKITFTLDKTNIATLSGERMENGWYKFPEVYLPAGYHELSLPEIHIKNLIEDGSFEDVPRYKNDSTEVSSDAVDGASSLKITAGKYGSREVSWQLNGLTRGTNYRLSFSYKTLLGGPLRLSIWQESSYKSRSLGNAEVNAPLYFYGKELDRDTSWNTFEKEFTWESSETTGRIVFLLPTSGDKSVSLIDDLKVEKIYDLDILLKDGENIIKDRSALPRITFTKVNPTRYKVLVSGVLTPYTLIFSESFNRGWKAYVGNTNPSPASSNFNGINTSYFGGAVTEVKGRDTFLDRQLFSTLLEKPIPEGRHLLVNGYANSWYILPNDGDGRSDYEITVEFIPQRLFYVGILISLVSAFLGVSYLVISGLRGIRNS